MKERRIMIRPHAVALAFVFTLGFAPIVRAQPSTPILTSGMTYAAKIDTDSSGSPTPNDCTFSPFIDPHTGALAIQAVQTGGVLLKACSIGPYIGSAILHSSGRFFNLAINQPAAGGRDIPAAASAIDESGKGGLPLAITRLDIANGLGSGQLCDVGGEPGIAARSSNGTFFVGGLNFYPDPVSPTHIKVPGLVMGMPFLCLQGKTGGRFCLDAYIPIKTDRTVDVMTQGVNVPSVLVDLDDLPKCPVERNAAPTASEWGIIGLIVALLVLGTWAISRRPSFAHSLPLP
jgi:hypothetical protein